MASREQALDTRELVARRLQGGGVDWRSAVLEALLLLTLLASLGVLFVLLADTIGKALPVLLERPVEFLTSPVSARPERAGILQAIVGSITVTAVVVLLAIPVGIGAAIYLEEYARDTRLARFIRTNIRNLAGVPAIVYGLLGLAVFSTTLGLGSALLAGGLTLAILVLPIVVITTSEALSAVPGAIREAAFGVGATRWETIRSHVLPYAAPGILTGMILSLARAFGETAPLLVVGAIAGTFSFVGAPWEQLFEGYTTLPTIVYHWSGDHRAEFRALSAAAIVVLLGVILLANATAIILRNRYDRKW
ncbi:MAG TPA: phosphate ABC transporter permease PstA [Candidatus Limnocylindria bacterium]|nr:phosphate ABC transporter permease PstA [Candidatus Limnocylindria bacterium]